MSRYPSDLHSVADLTTLSLSEEHHFTKPNDERALQLMDHAARDVMNEFKDIMLAFGESDEYRYESREHDFCLHH